jgi:hypothetical protein
MDVKQAVKIAREFLVQQAGFFDWNLQLEEVHLESGKWEIKFKYECFLHPAEYCTVSVDDTRAEVVGFRKATT